MEIDDGMTAGGVKAEKGCAISPDVRAASPYPYFSVFGALFR